ncbi:hypothetical protein [Dialister succinatiphilus]|uniref:hypothetical protein n=1 Tax=Dialister succinatiphilus TaxID=487173 RepID=UPI003AF1A483
MAFDIQFKLIYQGIRDVFRVRSLSNNYFAIASALFGFIACPILIPLAIIFVMKFVGAIICRIALDTIYKGDFKHGN